MATQTSVSEALDRLWVRFLPEIDGRVRLLELAAATLGRGPLDPSESEEAASAAHKLAGVLGTFGLAGGSVLAREAELFYAAPAEAEVSPRRMAEIAAGLREMIEQGR